MRTAKRFVTVMALAVVAMGMMTANAQTVWNMNVGRNTGPGETFEITTGEDFQGAATENTVNSTWNPVSAAGTGIALKDSTGAATGVTLDFGDPDGGDDFVDSNIAGHEIFDSYFGGGGIDCTVTLNGLDGSATYDLVVYAAWKFNADNSTAVSQTAGAGMTGTIYINSAGGNQPSLIEDTDPADNAAILGNWYRITGLTPNGSGQLAFQVTGAHNNDPLSGFQLVEFLPLAGTVSLSGSIVASNAAPGTLVGNLSMVNTNGTFTYALDASGDYTYFDISTGTTNLRTAAWIDSDQYDISIIGTESGGGGLVVTNDFTINVDPVAANKMAFVVAADVQSGAADGAVVGTAQTDVSGATFSIIDGREDLFYMDGADLKLTNSSDWGSIGTTNYVRLQASVGAATNELVVAAGVISGASAGTIFIFR